MDPLPAARPARRLGLIGAESTGKSTLARALGDALDACVVPERLRDFVDRHGRPPRADEQRDLLRAQQAAEDAVAAGCGSGLVVADPAPLMTAVYSLAYYDDDTLLAEGLEGARGCLALAWCRPDFPWVADPGQRDGPDRRAEVDALLGGIVRDLLVPAGIVVLDVTGPTPHRVERVQRAWQRLAHEGPT